MDFTAFLEGLREQLGVFDGMLGELLELMILARAFPHMIEFLGILKEVFEVEL